MGVRTTMILALVAGLAPTARGDDARTRAREHFQRGSNLYDLGRYVDAAKQYEAAYELKNDPALLFNIGQAYRGAREYEKAIIAYRSFLRRMPDVRNRAEVEARIAEMQRILEEQSRTHEAPPVGTQPPLDQPATPEETTPAPPPAPAPAEAAPPAPVLTASAPPPPRRPGRVKIIAGFATAGAGLALIAVGAAFTALAEDQKNQLEQPAPGTVFDPEVEQRWETYNAAGLALLSIGGAALAAGGVVGGLGLRERLSPRVSFAPSLGPTRVAGTLQLRF